jgi:MYND finger
MFSYLWQVRCFCRYVGAIGTPYPYTRSSCTLVTRRTCASVQRAPLAQQLRASSTPAGIVPVLLRYALQHHDRCVPMQTTFCCQCCHAVATNMPACNRCNLARYCSSVCQKADWKMHKFECTEWKDERGARERREVGSLANIADKPKLLAWSSFLTTLLHVRFLCSRALPAACQTAVPVSTWPLTRGRFAWLMLPVCSPTVAASAPSGWPR